MQEVKEGCNLVDRKLGAAGAVFSFDSGNIIDAENPFA